VICLYAMHRYDLVFYARLIEALKCSNIKGDFQLLIHDQIYYIPNAGDFIRRIFPNYLIVPTRTKGDGGIIGKIFSIVKLRAWVKSHINNECLLVLTDKSSPVSRLFLKRSSNAVLIQQIEEIGGDYTFDLKATVRDAIVCIALGAYFAKWYVSSSSGGFVRALKPAYMHKNIIKLYHVTDSIAPVHFSLPSLNGLSRQNSIVIFGSRFLSWPFFRSGIFEHRLELLTKIYAFIHVSFPHHRLIYLPHPLEKGDDFNFVNNIFHGRCERVNSYFSSEHFLYENRKIDYTFSMGSTSSFSAFNMGFSAKVFYKMFDFPGTIQSTYDRIFSGLPESFFADQIGDLIMPCVRESLGSDANGLVPIMNALHRK
jgi:hypothetical protein